MRQRLLVSSLALVLTALIAFAVPLGWAVRGLLVGGALDELQGNVEPVGLVLDASRNCAELQLRLAQLRDAPFVLTVVGADGTIVATTAVGQLPPVGQELADARAGGPGRQADAGRLAVAQRLSTPVCGQSVVLHSVAGDDVLRARIRGAWVAIALVAGIVAAAAAGAAWVGGRRLAAPFERLATAAGRLGDGDFSVRAPRSSLPEADRIADALDDTAERLGRSVERAGTLAADASHQLRTPLTALRLHLETLEVARPDDPNVLAALSEADRLEATIDDFVALTRPDEAPEELDLAALARSRLDGMSDLAGRAGRELRFEALPVPRVRARPGAVGQALQVLLDNAIEHGSGAVVVRLAPALPDEPRGAVRLCVLDDGPAAGGPARSRPGPDASGGRGLLLARALVQAEGGELTVSITADATSACLLLPGLRRRGPQRPAGA